MPGMVYNPLAGRYVYNWQSRFLNTAQASARRFYSPTSGWTQEELRAYYAGRSTPAEQELNMSLPENLRYLDVQDVRTALAQQGNVQGAAEAQHKITTTAYQSTLTPGKQLYSDVQGGMRTPEGGKIEYVLGQRLVLYPLFPTVKPLVPVASIPKVNPQPTPTAQHDYYGTQPVGLNLLGTFQKGVELSPELTGEEAPRQIARGAAVSFGSAVFGLADLGSEFVLRPGRFRSIFQANIEKAVVEAPKQQIAFAKQKPIEFLAGAASFKFAGSFGKAIGYEKVEIPTETGTATAYRGIRAFNRPLLGVSEAKVTISTPAFSDVLLASFKKGGAEGEAYRPSTALETNLLASKRVITKLYEQIEFEKQTAARTVSFTTQIQNTAFLQKAFIEQTQTLSPQGVKTVLAFAKQKGGTVYGSFASVQQLPLGALGRVPADIDLYLKTTSVIAQQHATELTAQLNKLGVQARLSPGTTLIETKTPQGTWRHAVDIHAIDEAISQVSKASPKAGEFGYGFSLNQPPIKLKGIELQRLSEQGLRKMASALEYRQKLEPAAHRLKDIQDFITVQEALLKSMGTGIAAPLKVGRRIIGEQALSRYKAIIEQQYGKELLQQAEPVKVELYSPKTKANLPKPSLGYASIPQSKIEYAISKAYPSASKSRSPSPSISKISPSLAKSTSVSPAKYVSTSKLPLPSVSKLPNYSKSNPVSPSQSKPVSPLIYASLPTSQSPSLPRASVPKSPYGKQTSKSYYPPKIGKTVIGNRFKHGGLKPAEKLIKPSKKKAFLVPRQDLFSRWVYQYATGKPGSPKITLKEFKAKVVKGFGLLSKPSGFAKAVSKATGGLVGRKTRKR